MPSTLETPCIVAFLWILSLIVTNFVVFIIMDSKLFDAVEKQKQEAEQKLKSYNDLGSESYYRLRKFWLDTVQEHITELDTVLEKLDEILEAEKNKVK